MIDLADPEARFESGNLANTISIEFNICFKERTPKLKTDTMPVRIAV